MFRATILKWDKVSNNLFFFFCFFSGHCYRHREILKDTEALKFIYSNSQAIFKVLESFTFESRLAWDCFNVANDMARVNNVTLKWVPGHTSITQRPIVGPEPMCWRLEPFQKCGWGLNREMEFLDEKISGLRQTKRSLWFSKSKTYKISIAMQKGLETGDRSVNCYCPIWYHLNKMFLLLYI